MKSIVYLIILLAVSSNVFSFDEVLIKRLQLVIDKQTSQHTSVGITIGLIDGGNRIILNSGMKDLEENIPLSGDEYFSIGSVSKTFTSLLLSLAVSDGKITLDEKVGNILAEFTNHKVGKLTLRQLSTHSSGIQRDPRTFSESGMLQPFENYTKDTLLKELKQATITPVHDNPAYSNLGIALLGLCLEEIFGDTYDAAIRENILAPLKLDNIMVHLADADIPLMSKKYSSLLKPLPIWRNLGIFNSVGSFKATASLMLDYLYAQLYPKRSILSDAIQNSQKKLYQYEGLSAAYGWFVLNKYNQDIYWHNGSTAGFSTEAYFLPASKKALIIFNNSGNKVECVAAIFLARKECEVKKITLDDEEVLQSYSGLYFSKEYNVRIQIESSKHGFATVQIIGQPPAVRLFKVGNNKYEF